MRHFHSYAVILVASFFLFSCATTKQTTQNNYQQNINKKNYLRIVQFVSEDPRLLEELKSTAEQNPNLLVTHQDNFSEFRIFANINGKWESKSKNVAPPLFGTLSKKQSPARFIIKYKMTNQRSHIIKEGKLELQSKSHTRIFPIMESSPPQIPEEMLKKASNEIIKELYNSIKTTPWSMSIIGEKNSHHLIASSGKDAGIKIAEFFETQTQPRALLQVVAFEKTPFNASTTNNTRAILRLISGEMPKIGSTLIPTKAPEYAKKSTHVKSLKNQNKF